MPELPEVEAARSIIAEHCVGRVITDVEAQPDEKVFDGASVEDVMAALKGRKVLSAGRKGKQMWLTLDGDGLMPLMHFGMTGFVAVRDAAEAKIHMVAYENAPKDTAANWPPRFLKLLLHFGPQPDRAESKSCQLAYCDARRFGRIKLVQGDPADSETVSKLGFDPLLEMPDLDTFTELLLKRGKGATRLKPLLLDQSFCAGVGNWVADEVLWQSRLHPEQLTSALEPQHVQTLHTALQQVVQTAVAVQADSSKFPPDWMFHVRWGKQAGSLLGHKLDHITVGSRTSCYVPALQKIIGGGKVVNKAKAQKAAAGTGARKPAGGRRKRKQTTSSSESSESEGDVGQGEQQQEPQQGSEEDQAGQQQQATTVKAPKPKKGSAKKGTSNTSTARKGQASRRTAQAAGFQEVDRIEGSTADEAEQTKENMKIAKSGKKRRKQ